MLSANIRKDGVRCGTRPETRPPARPADGPSANPTVHSLSMGSVERAESGGRTVSECAPPSRGRAAMGLLLFVTRGAARRRQTRGDMPKSCRKLVTRLVWERHLLQSAQFRPIMAKSGECWPHEAQTRPKLARIGETGQMSLQTSAQTWFGHNLGVFLRKAHKYVLRISPPIPLHLCGAGHETKICSTRPQRHFGVNSWSRVCHRWSVKFESESIA